jgi:hypothetical protein
MNKHIYLAGHFGLSSIHLRLEDCRTFFVFVPATLIQGNVKRRIWVSFRGLVRALQLNKRVPAHIFLIFV